MMVSLVPKEHVPACWESVKGHLAKAAEYTYGRYEVDDILDAIMDYDYHLWIAFDDDGIHAAVVTKFSQYPRRKYMDMVFTGGERLSEWKEPMLKLLQAWAIIVMGLNRQVDPDGQRFLLVMGTALFGIHTNCLRLMQE